MSHAAEGSTPRHQWAPDARALGVVGDRWVMVIVRDLAAGPLRRKTLGRLLPGLSAGALQERLNHMEEAGLLVRHRESALPPRVDFELTEAGYALARVVAELARWELRTRWSAPREDEWVDIGAWFRLATLLVPHEAPSPAADGVLALEIRGDGETELERYTFIRQAGRARLERRDTPEAEARLSGAPDAWVRALSPGGMLTELDVRGRVELASAFLELFASEPVGSHEHDAR